MPTIRSIARSLGVSSTTVSESLRGLPRVNEATRLRVHAAARTAGYQPNPLASAVMSNVRRERLATFHGVIAAINFVESSRPAFPGPFLRDLLQGATQRAVQLGFTLERLNVGCDARAAERLDLILQSRGIRGVIVLPAWNRPNFARFAWRHYTGVYADCDEGGAPTLNSVCANHHSAMALALGQLSALGFRRPGLVMQRHHSERLQHHWVAAFLAGQYFHRGLTAIPPYVEDEITPEGFRDWFLQHQPDVVLSHPVEIISWMQACGAKVPETHGFCCLNVSLSDRPCAGVDLQPHQIGARCAEQVIAQVCQNDYGLPGVPCTTTIPSRWADGPTVTARARIARKSPAGRPREETRPTLAAATSGRRR